MGISGLPIIHRSELKEGTLMARSGMKKAALSLAIAGAFAAVSLPASAAFFQIAENSASGIGNAFAGGAAVAEDASTVWYNPAGMTRLKDAQLVVSGHYIHPSFKASVNSASTSLGFPISGGGGEAGESAFVPNLYATFPVSARFALGLGVNAPFGLATDYDSTWAGRYHALRSDIKTVNANLGGANACGAPGFIQPGAPNDGKARVTATGHAWGYNRGLLAQLGDTRVGLAYRSKMKQKLNGDFDITAPANVPPALLNDPRFQLVDSGAKADVTLPSTLSLSAYSEIGKSWAVMADVTRTGWRDLPELRIMFDSGQADQVVTLNLKNTYRYSLGATYKPGGSWVLRTGIALDKSPVSGPTVGTPRLPDSDRRWLSFGAGLQASPRLNFDFAYSYIKLAGSNVTKTDGGAGTENFGRGNLSVDYKGSVQIFSAQARWTF